MSNTPRRHPIAGNWASLLLPIREDDSIDFEKLGEEIDILIAAKVDGIYSNGTAGEFHNQTEAEYERIQEVLAWRCRAADMAFVIGACQPDPIIMLDRLRRATVHKPLAIQVILPDWWPLTNPEATDFLKRASEVAEGIPLVLYNPPHAKRVLSPTELGEVCGPCPSVVGMKIADGDDAWYAQARAHLSEFSLFIPGHHLATGMKQGVAAGAFSNVACLDPRGAQAWTELMHRDIDAALEIERRICAFMDDYIVPFRRDHGYSNAALDKLLAAIGNWGPITTRLRWPYRFINEQEAVRLRDRARLIMPELFAH
ncbi:dihydrodipicolinate synthase family protein [Rhizobium lentis]|uniref:dihydrodipicolinate synthase family protein n=1 Tax=Rhizobium lentis TaxID=1138194 RepID=UPI001C83A3B7|nr:dihydrodipicolinate synthase family protein [Rhizobium lentis]MBX5043484.1 dihydrodipicolinate synthase family protein [Rhizobium lentis]MBX5056192.1 dihydrodipicolinate synthase family protein [Rhizobium lentis]MBX5074146.1 dihydrodipicolinate synthase family protein [Rhizobium lentis]MBX5111471.1 dihydrodipicolinate synthase family protein [Rhizobium lentis]MBX5117617.1 dihydrodipicolinate synthase family protein [Rhizobium lentis]